MEFTGTCPKTLPNDVQLKEPSKRLVWELISPLDILDSTRQKGGMQMHSLLGAQEKKTLVRSHMEDGHCPASERLLLRWKVWL